MELENDKVMMVFEWASCDLFLVKKYKWVFVATAGFDAMTTCESHVLFLCVLETCFVTASFLTQKQ